MKPTLHELSGKTEDQLSKLIAVINQTMESKRQNPQIAYQPAYLQRTMFTIQQYFMAKNHFQVSSFKSVFQFLVMSKVEHLYMYIMP